MDCEYCHHKIGYNYRGEGECLCHFCANKIDTTGLPCTYLGKSADGIFHLYRIHPAQFCWECGADLNIISNPCGYSEYDETVSNLFKERTFVYIDDNEAKRSQRNG